MTSSNSSPYSESSGESSEQNISKMHRIAQQKRDDEKNLRDLDRKFGGWQNYRIINNSDEHLLCDKTFIAPHDSITYATFCYAKYKYDRNNKRIATGQSITIYVGKRSRKHRHDILIPMGYNVVTISVNTKRTINYTFTYDHKLFSKKPYEYYHGDI